VRTQLKSVFTKTGVGRQAELVTLLSAHGLRTPHWRVTPE
jgi:DNA-binding CsgD family transcriptional regulator